MRVVGATIIPRQDVAPAGTWTAAKTDIRNTVNKWIRTSGAFDAVLTMYHDQGRIAMKTTDFGKIVITMIGVPVPFLTVAHGTGHDIAGKGKADPSNFVDLLQFADRLN